MLWLDDRSTVDLTSAIGPKWRLVTDQVMGGASHGTLAPGSVAGRSCLRLSGTVSLANGGGFVQAALDLPQCVRVRAPTFSGVRLVVRGNGRRYHVHLRTADCRLPWQSYRAGFTAEPRWQTVRLPFAGFSAYRISAALDVTRLCRLGLVAIGAAFRADICIAELALYASPRSI